jgi:hypothetical protein
MSTSIASWPSVRDVTRQLDLSQVYVNRLISRGVIHAVRTRIGWLVDPESVRVYASERAARKAAGKR